MSTKFSNLTTTSDNPREPSFQHQAGMLTSLLDAIPDLIFFKDLNGIYLGCNTAFADHLGRRKEDIAGKTDYDLYSSDEADQFRANDRRMLEQGSPRRNEEWITYPDGRLVLLDTLKTPFRDGSGQIIGILGVSRDITERKNMETLLEQMLQFTYNWEYWTDTQGRFLFCSPACERITGYAAEAFENNPQLMLEIVHPEDRPRLEMHLDDVKEEGWDAEDLEFRIITRTGEVRWLSHRCRTMPLPDGTGTGRRGCNRDITERKTAEASLLQFKSIFDNANFGAAIANMEGRLTYVNKYMATIHGYAASELIGQPFTIMHGPDHQAEVHRLQQDLYIQGHFDAQEVWHVHRDGTAFPMLMTGMRVDDAKDRPQCYVATAVDISDRKALEAQLFQAQKMESIGQLAGGVAHDFNNMLSVVIGHTELALYQLDGPHPVARDLQEIHKAAQRAASLTRQLLAFARKQAITPQVLNLNETIEGMLKMLRRLLGENLLLNWEPGANLWPVRMDPSQVDQILANLCVNARDAINGAGQVTIATRNTRAIPLTDAVTFNPPPQANPSGEYVLLTVTDTGSGIPADVLLHIFEPFYTTKAVGQGTGMGLATVYGIVRQNNGVITVSSTPEEGTTFTVYLPRHVGDQTITGGRKQTAAPALGHETILLVEDEAAVLHLWQTVLKELGYQVLAAGTAAEALRQAEAAATIDLLITDVIMPDLSGPELARRLLQNRPNLKVLYMSGYPSDFIARHGVPQKDAFFIQKPFNMTNLAEKVRQVLGEG